MHSTASMKKVVLTFLCVAAVSALLNKLPCPYDAHGPAHVQAARDDSEDDLSDDDSDADEEGAPVMHLRQVSQPCGINRVRAMPQQSSIVAAWGEDAQVQVSRICHCPQHYHELPLGASQLQGLAPKRCNSCIILSPEPWSTETF